MNAMSYEGLSSYELLALRMIPSHREHISVEMYDMRVRQEITENYAGHLSDRRFHTLRSSNENTLKASMSLRGEFRDVQLNELHATTYAFRGLRTNILAEIWFNGVHFPSKLSGGVLSVGETFVIIDARDLRDMRIVHNGITYSPETEFFAANFAFIVCDFDVTGDATYWSPIFGNIWLYSGGSFCMRFST